MTIDCHVHAVALTEGHGNLSGKLERSLPVRIMRRMLHAKESGAELESAIRRMIFSALDGAKELDAVALLAFDAVYRHDGMRDDPVTHLFVTNDYVIEMARQHPKILFGASVHPYRKDAVAEVERCIKAGAVLLKWLPIVQDFDPADEKCFPVYEVLAHYKLPLLCHTGGESSLPNQNKSVADPALLVAALRRGVTVIAAHCGTRSRRWETDFSPTFLRMCRQYETFYGDTAALNLPARWYVYERILNDPIARTRLVHGSDWPIPPIPSPRHVGVGGALAALRNSNWLDRDMRLKRRIGFDEAYFARAATVLRLPKEIGVV